MSERLKQLVDKLLAQCKEKFDASIDICINFVKLDKGETVRTNMELLHGKKKALKVWVFTENINEALKNGATRAGVEDLMNDIKNGVCDADICLADENVFSRLVSIMKILGPKGLMPNKKNGTVSDNIISVLKTVTEGKQFLLKSDSAGYIHGSIGSKSFSSEQICENIISVVHFLKKFKSNRDIKNICLSSTMGMGFKIPLSAVVT